MKTKNLKEDKVDLPFEEYLGFDPVTEDLPPNWFAPVTISFAYRKIIRERQMALPYRVKV